MNNTTRRTGNRACPLRGVDSAMCDWSSWFNSVSTCSCCWSTLEQLWGIYNTVNQRVVCLLCFTDWVAVDTVPLSVHQRSSTVKTYKNPTQWITTISWKSSLKWVHAMFIPLNGKPSFLLFSFQAFTLCHSCWESWYNKLWSLFNNPPKSATDCVTDCDCDCDSVTVVVWLW